MEPAGISSLRAARTKPIRWLLELNFDLGLPRRRRLRHHHVALEILGHARMQTNFSWPLGQRHLVNLVLQLQQGVNQALRARWTPHHVHVYRDDPIDALEHGIGVEWPTYA